MTFLSSVSAVTGAPTWDARVNEIRLLPMRHGIAALPDIYAEIARTLYVPSLAPDFAYVPDAPHYEPPYFREVYESASNLTANFTKVTEADLKRTLLADPRTLLVLRTITGLLRNEFAAATEVVIQRDGLTVAPIKGAKVASTESKGTKLADDQAFLAARTIDSLLNGLFTTAPVGRRSKQEKPDTEYGWTSVEDYARDGVPYEVFLHQRHYGGAYNQVTSATGTKKGDVLEDAAEDLFKQAGVPYLRTGSHNQGEIVKRFGVTVTPAPDFVLFDDRDELRGLLECKSISDGGTARDKAARFRSLNSEAARLGGVAVIGVLDGLGWTRVKDALGPVVQYTDGRVFTSKTLPDMLTVMPVSALVGMAP